MRAVSTSKPRLRISATAGESCFTRTGIVWPRSRMWRVSRTTCVSAPDMCDGVITCSTRRGVNDCAGDRGERAATRAVRWAR